MQSKGDLVSTSLKESAGAKCCSIFRVHHNLSQYNPESYGPTLVSIGPYHSGKKHVEMMQEHKHRYLKIFLEKGAKEGVSFADLVDSVSLLEEEIRNSYSENLVHLDREKLIDMMAENM